ncbi:PD-(D/E)XK nuclease family protein [Croceitalea rosinachiae]|uniref:PD-(D/E)XK nuclease family protein n=1 Tax=Croceitalea rosinachiae TaxID=3075596 RepID=A0ABU3A969_9FLAO|nr:PD-(D/E)XK nuclease family protein [Croceitalea sp. F388]MDT0606435.1 PD-(D/E)XK nuclease family protein [Croceitalea sp. F388]
MDSFLQYVTKNTYNKYGSFENLIFVVPSVRSGTYLKKYIAQLINTPIFSPTIISIENFIQEVSQLRKTPNTELVFRLYNIYLKSDIKEKDDFFSFNRWCQTLLADFDELDRYLIDTHSLFDYLTALTKIKEWGKTNNLTTLITDYVKFTKSFKYLYDTLTDDLLKTKDSYQGLRYKEAVKNIKLYINQTETKSHIFVGFNALNSAEEFVIQKILKESNSEIYWDIDEYFLKDSLHDARYFIHKHKKNWSYLTDKPLNGISNHYLSKKRFEITGIPKNISQAKFIGSLLSKIHLKKDSNQPIALVLADETLLPAVLNSIPLEVTEINITMGYPLSDTTVSNFFSILIDFHISASNDSWYFKDILRLLSNPISITLLDSNEALTSMLIEKILKNNYSYLSAEELHGLIKHDSSFFNGLFPLKKLNSKEFINLSVAIVSYLKSYYTQANQLIESESLQLFHKLFNQLSQYTTKLDYLKDLKPLKAVLVELISLEKLNFQGSATDGLQIMGMLESRTLGFETVIISSINEGILPAGKSNNSFIPYDVKKEYHMPTFKDKDAVYTYHFYRLLQRAKNIYLTYNTEHDVLEGGEKSRFITQLMTDSNLTGSVIHQIAVQDTPSNLYSEKQIDKTPMLLKQIKQICSSGFSPTSLTNYIKNPYGFYKQHILKIKDLQQVEETIAHNTFGTIIHDTLEDLYTPYIGKTLNKTLITSLKKRVEVIVRHNFSKSYSDKNIEKGQNLIVLKVINKYIQSALDFEIQEVEKKQIKVLALEQELKIELDIPDLDFPVFLKGKLDRIDEVDGQLRIIDYKTGQVTSSELEISTFEELTLDDKKTKAFQLLCYALLYCNKNSIQFVNAGILPIKNLNKGILYFAKKSTAKPISKNNSITEQLLQDFQSQLKHLILEITNPNIPFKETLV